jgi:hypothetical protein
MHRACISSRRDEQSTETESAAKAAFLNASSGKPILNARSLPELNHRGGRRNDRRKKRTVMSLVRIAASAVIFAALSAACAAAKPVVTTGDTNLRKAAGTAPTDGARPPLTGKTVTSSGRMSAWRRGVRRRAGRWSLAERWWTKPMGRPWCMGRRASTTDRRVSTPMGHITAAGATAMAGDGAGSAATAFSSEADAGSRDENASKQKIGAVVLMQSEPLLQSQPAILSPLFPHADHADHRCPGVR